MASPQLGGGGHHLEDRPPAPVADLVAGGTALAAEEAQRARLLRADAVQGEGLRARAAPPARGRWGRSGAPGAGRSRRRARPRAASAARPSWRRPSTAWLARWAATTPITSTLGASWVAMLAVPASGSEKRTSASGLTATMPRSVSSISLGVLDLHLPRALDRPLPRRLQRQHVAPAAHQEAHQRIGRGVGAVEDGRAHEHEAGERLHLAQQADAVLQLHAEAGQLLQERRAVDELDGGAGPEGGGQRLRDELVFGPLQGGRARRVSGPVRARPASSRRTRRACA